MTAATAPNAADAAHRVGEDLSRNWALVALRGLLAIVFGAIALIVPVATMLALALLFSAYALVDGVVAIFSAVRAATRRKKWGLLALDGVVSIIAGVVAFLWPGLTLLAFVLIVAAWSILSGALQVAAAFGLDTGRGRWLLGLGGVLSVVFGGLLIAAPLIGALVLTWWLGAYAIVFGAMLIWFAFTLRSSKAGKASTASSSQARA